MVWLVIAIVAVCLMAAAIAFLSTRRSDPANTLLPADEDRTEDWEFPPRNEGSSR